MRYAGIRLATTTGWVPQPAEDPGLLHHKTRSWSAEETRRRLCAVWMIRGRFVGGIGCGITFFHNCVLKTICVDLK